MYGNVFSPTVVNWIPSFNLKFKISSAYELNLKGLLFKIIIKVLNKVVSMDI